MLNVIHWIVFTRNIKMIRFIENQIGGKGRIGNETDIPDFLKDTLECKLLKMLPNVTAYRYCWTEKSSSGKEVGSAYLPTKESIHIGSGILPRLSHEIGHLLEERRSEKWVAPNFGLQFSPIGSGFFRALSRETRVTAIEAIITNRDYDKLSAWTNYGNRYLHTTPFQTYNRLDEWHKDYYSKIKSQWSIDRIHHEWAKRVEYITNWMETK